MTKDYYYCLKYPGGRIVTGIVGLRQDEVKRIESQLKVSPIDSKGKVLKTFQAVIERTDIDEE